jgi:hypothetical protein
MKRAQAGKLAPTARQLYLTANQLAEIGALAQLIEEGIWK